MDTVLVILDAQWEPVAIFGTALVLGAGAGVGIAVGVFLLLLRAVRPKAAKQ